MAFRNILVGNLTHLLNKSKFGVSVPVDNFIAKHGNEQIKTLVLVRNPIAKLTIETINLVSPNFKNKNHYPTLYHSYAIVNGKYKIDKRETLHIEPFHNMSSGSESLPVTIRNPITIYELLNNIKTDMGIDKIRGYSAKDNNCQHFMLSLLNTNGLATEENKAFIKQHTEELFTDELRKTTNTITDTARTVLPYVDSTVAVVGSYMNPMDLTPFKLQGNNPM